jgi:hypothetical protein
VRQQQREQRVGSPSQKVKIPGYVNTKKDDTAQKLLQMKLDFYE